MTQFIIDCGFHTGVDAEYYMRKGFRVCGIEANPSLNKLAKEKFEIDINKGKLILIEAAIVSETYDRDTVSFYENDLNTEWGTISEDFMNRNRRYYGAHSKEIEVDTVKLSEIFLKYGTPHYIKIDVEGSDFEVLGSLRGFSEVPKFLSLESEQRYFEKLVHEIECLQQLGYSKFQAVQQRIIPGSKVAVHDVTGLQFEYKFPRSSSGVFGDDLPSENWKNYSEIIDEYRKIFIEYERWGPYSRVRKMIGGQSIAFLQLITGKPLPGWFDTHAAL